MNKGFTLVELLIVIAILAILSSIALPIYLSYRQKAKVTSVALPYAEECSREIINYCINLKPSSSTSFNLSALSLKDCQDKSLSLYNTDLDISGSFVCEPDGEVSSGTVNASLSDISSFSAVCVINSEGIKCSVSR